MLVPPDMMARYMERRRQDLAICFQSLEKQNFVELERVGHKLKGTAETFGYPELSRIGKKLEKAAVQKDTPSLEGAIEEFSYWVEERASLDSSL